MKLKSKNIFQAIAILGTLTLTGCSSQILSENEIEEFVSYVYNQTENSELDFNEFQKQISKNLPRIENKEIASQIMNDYIYILYNEVNQYISYFNIIGDELDIIKKKLNIDEINVSMYKEIYKESKVIGAILEEMKAKNLMVVDKNNIYTIEVDMNKIIEEFGQYFTDDLINFMKFREDEIINPIYDNNTDKYDINLLVKRVSIAIDNIKNNNKSSQLSNWQSSAEYYYQLILAESTNQFLDPNSEGKKVSVDYIKELKEVLKNHKNTFIYDDISKYIELLEENDYSIDSQEVANYRNQILNNIFEIENNQSESEIESTPNENSIDSKTHN